jgi:hypothetical protein
VWQITQAFALAILRWLIDAGGASPGHGPLYTAYIGLYQLSSPSVGWLTTMGQIVEASYDGYARQEIVWYPPYQGTAGPATLEGASLMFAPTDALVPQTIGGIILADSLTGGDLWAGQPLPAPGTPLTGPLTVLKVVPDIALTQQLVYGGCAVFS